jgi:hypothetical protein
MAHTFIVTVADDAAGDQLQAHLARENGTAVFRVHPSDPDEDRGPVAEVRAQLVGHAAVPTELVDGYVGLLLPQAPTPLEGDAPSDVQHETPAQDEADDDPPHPCGTPLFCQCPPAQEEEA